MAFHVFIGHGQGKFQLAVQEILQAGIRGRRRRALGHCGRHVPPLALQRRHLLHGQQKVIFLTGRHHSFQPGGRIPCLAGGRGNSSGSCGGHGSALLVGGAALFLLFLELLHLRHGALLFHGKAALPRSLTAGRTAVSRLALHIAHGGQEQGGVLVVRRHGSLARDTLAAVFPAPQGHPSFSAAGTVLFPEP